MLPAGKTDDSAPSGFTYMCIPVCISASRRPFIITADGIGLADEAASSGWVLVKLQQRRLALVILVSRIAVTSSAEELSS